MLWNLECPVGLSQREICALFNVGNLAQFGLSAEETVVELRGVFELSRPKVAQMIYIRIAAILFRSRRALSKVIETLTQHEDDTVNSYREPPCVLVYTKTRSTIFNTSSCRGSNTSGQARPSQLSSDVNY